MFRNTKLQKAIDRIGDRLGTSGYARSRKFWDRFEQDSLTRQVYMENMESLVAAQKTFEEKIADLHESLERVAYSGSDDLLEIDEMFINSYDDIISARREANIALIMAKLEF